MFQKLSLLLLIWLSVFCSSRSLAQGFLRADGKKIVNEKGENVLLRGVGLGGWMLQEGYMLKINKEGQQYRIRERLEELMGAKQTGEFYDLWLANHTRKIDIDSMKAWGFNSVRLPMHYNLYTLPVEKESVNGQNTWLEKGFAMTDSLLAWCKANQMYLILDLHAAPGGQGNDVNISDRDPSKPSLWDSEANQQKTIALWRKLAERYVNEPWIGGYDLINEPNWGFDDPVNDKNGTKEKNNAPLKKLMIDITKAIREVDKKHMIIIEGNGWGNNYNGILPQWDNNMVLSFHKYWSYNDQASAGHMIKARDKYNIPVWVGETGENSNVWFTEAIRLFETNNIGWAWWPLKKIGVNNPVEIKSNLNYDSVVGYLNGGGNKPKESNVYSGLMELAVHTRLENTTIHRDVIDAMIRQPFSAETKPFKKHIVQNRIVINAVDYDLGRNGVAYFDKDTADYHVSNAKHKGGNKGRMYRNDGVDIIKDPTAYEAYYIYNIESGEWLNYTMEVKKKGNYTIKLKVAADNDNGRISILSNGKLVSKDILVPNTGGLSDFQFIEIKNVPLNAGKQTLTVLADVGFFNFSQLQFNK
ncbi:cellulase family glycosylhydrolase [Pedobacter hiemivivus]|uniref:Carbohydrate-binding protein n=1 Tax=Pedobacter hiemivivus TaxID=2530454 RepID=A0A4R0N717_9SPHI|nr:cellulase family glycosylhydrolase [Pedobacter hiemivivus]TCC95871.1 carbohydrate-binding protein [Pedobacter hiemivivus]